jgi:hypothetical protein
MVGETATCPHEWIDSLQKRDPSGNTELPSRSEFPAIRIPRTVWTLDHRSFTSLAVVRLRRVLIG